MQSQVSKDTVQFTKKGKQHNGLNTLKAEQENYLPAERIHALKRIYLHGICGRNSHGQTVVIDRIGNIKINQLAKVVEDDELIGYTFQRLIEIKARLKGDEQVVWVFDVGGKIMQLASKRIIDLLMKIIRGVQLNFPNMLDKIIFVNTPLLFDTVWNKLVPHIAKETLKKIIMVADQYAALDDLQPIQILPNFLGGEREEEFFMEKAVIELSGENQSEDEEVDFSLLKQALGGTKMGGYGSNSVSHTPLNTQTDEC